MSEKRKVNAGVGVLILKDGKILLGRRHEDPDKADSELRGEGTWTMPGGGVEWGEDFEYTAIREAEEETGLKLNNVKVICVNNDKNEHAHFVTIGLLCESFEGEPEVKEPDEVVEWKWFDINYLPKPLYFPSERVLDCYLNKEFYIKR